MTGARVVALALSLTLVGCASLPTPIATPDECAVLRAVLVELRDDQEFARRAILLGALSDHTASGGELALPYKDAKAIPKHRVALRGCAIDHVLPPGLSLVPERPKSMPRTYGLSTPAFSADGAGATVGFADGTRGWGMLFHLVRKQDGWSVDEVTEWITVT